MADRKRVVLVTNEILGLVRTGGAGTATTFLSFALAGLGHDVEILFTDTSITAELDSDWARRYAERDIAIRRLESGRERVLPRSMTTPYAVQQALKQDPPDLVIANDWGGPAYAAFRSRQLGLDFPRTTFVVYCHGPNQWLYDARRKLRRSLGSFESQALERSSIELADLVVSPSAHLIRWMTELGWTLPQAVVVPYFTQSAVEGRSMPKVAPGAQVKRLAFFGRLEEAKGVEPYIEALNRLPANLLAGIELLFVGKETKLWHAERVKQELAGPLKTHAATLRFETDLDQPEAIALLSRPGTLAVMPSVADNSPNVVYECLEHGIPFLASKAGGGPELVAAEDRARTFVEPTPDGIREGLARRLTVADLTPAQASFDAEHLFAAWGQIVATAPPPHAQLDVGIDAAKEDFVLVHEEGDELDPGCLDTLLRAQAASGADVVTCGVRGRLGKREEINLFLGEPRELGLVANYYGLLGLFRRSLLDGWPSTQTEGDDAWVRLASLSLAGARIVSVPAPLARSARKAGSAATDPAESGAALAVVHAFERACPAEARLLPRLVAGVAARRDLPQDAPSAVERLRWIWEHEGAAGIARRVTRLLTRRRLGLQRAAVLGPRSASAKAP